MPKTSLTRQIWSAVLPISCLDCGEESDWICDSCRRSLRLQLPDRCFCGKVAVDGLCDKHRQELRLDGLTTLWAYAEPTARELIHALKYRGHIDTVTWLAQSYGRTVLTALPRGDWTVTAVPLAKERQRTRGFNQSELFARQLTQPMYNYAELLIRQRNTQPQVELNRSERQKNLTKAFVIKPRATVPEQVILVDDVLTTGSTLLACVKVLRQAGVQKIWALTIAHG